MAARRGAFRRPGADFYGSARASTDETNGDETMAPRCRDVSIVPFCRAIKQLNDERSFAKRLNVSSVPRVTARASLDLPRRFDCCSSATCKCCVDKLSTRELSSLLSSLIWSNSSRFRADHGSGFSSMRLTPSPPSSLFISPSFCCTATRQRAHRKLSERERA